MVEQESNWITLVDEDGAEHRFDLISVIEVEEKKYALMLPENQDESDPESEAIILRMETDESGNEVLVDIEDDEEYERVCVALEEMEEFDEEEESENV